MNTKRTCINVASLACGLFIAQSALAGVHTWDVVEVFSNADGNVQYIEVKEMNNTNGEWHLAGIQVTSTSGGVFTFPANYPATVANKSILLATADCAALPGMPTPDHIISDDFFNPAGDTVRFNGAQDSLPFLTGIPTDCVQSFNDGGVLANNAPKNYAGTVGFITDCGEKPPVCLGDTTGDGEVNIDDYTDVILNWNTAGPAGDTDNDGDVDIDDYTNVILNWQTCNPPFTK